MAAPIVFKNPRNLLSPKYKTKLATRNSVLEMLAVASLCLLLTSGVLALPISEGEALSELQDLVQQLQAAKPSARKSSLPEVGLSIVSSPKESRKMAKVKRERRRKSSFRITDILLKLMKLSRRMVTF